MVLTALRKSVVLLVIGLIGIIYSQVVGFDFIWDDSVFLVDSSTLRSDSWYAILTEPFIMSVNYYRPLVVFSFFLDGRLSDFDASFMHGTNLLIFGLNVYLVWHLAKRFASHLQFLDDHSKTIFPYLVTMVYFVHPANIESAAWVSGRFDLLVTFFLLSCLLVDGSSIRPQFRYPLLFSCYLAACLSKEMAVSFPMLVFLWHFVVSESTSTFSGRFWVAHFRRNGLTYAVLLAAGLSYLGIRYAALGYLLEDASTDHIGDGVQHFLLVSKAYGMYLFSSLLPFAYSSPIHKEYFPISYDDRLAVVSALIMIAAFLGAVIFVQRRRVYAVLYLLFFISLLPVLHVKVMPIYENIIQERFLAFPLVFLSMLLVAVFLRIATAVEASRFIRGSVLALFSFWVAASLFILSTQLPMWQNNHVFWAWAREKAPDSVVANVNLAVMTLDKGDVEKAIYYAKTANYLEPGRLSGAIVLANAHMQKKEFDLAEATVKELLASERYLSSSEVKEAVNTLGLISLRSGDYEKAEEIFRDILGSDKYYHQAMINLGSALYCLGNVEEANEYWNKSLSLLHSEKRDQYKQQFDRIMAKGVDCVKSSAEAEE